MAHKKKGHLTASGEWVKHLRKELKRQFWKGERNAGAKYISDEIAEDLANANYQFDELVKTLIALSSNSEKQKHIYGIGVAGDEMAEDFYSYYTLMRSTYLKFELIDEVQASLLDKFDESLTKKSGSKHVDFWMDTGHDAWEEIRRDSSEILQLLNKSHLDLVVEHDNEWTEDGRKIVAQKTTATLIDKTTHNTMQPPAGRSET